jgi:hypothetical protein
MPTAGITTSLTSEVTISRRHDDDADRHVDDVALHRKLLEL